MFSFVVALSLLCAWGRRVRDETTVGQCFCKTSTSTSQNGGMDRVNVDADGVKGPAGQCCDPSNCGECSRYGQQCCSVNPDKSRGECGKAVKLPAPEWTKAWNYPDTQIAKACQCGGLTYTKKQLHDGSKSNGANTVKANCKCQPETSCADCHSNCKDKELEVQSKGTCCSSLDDWCKATSTVKKMIVKNNKKCTTDDPCGECE